MKHECRDLKGLQNGRPWFRAVGDVDKLLRVRLTVFCVLPDLSVIGVRVGCRNVINLRVTVS